MRCTDAAGALCFCCSHVIMSFSTYSTSTRGQYYTMWMISSVTQIVTLSVSVCVCVCVFNSQRILSNLILGANTRVIHPQIPGEDERTTVILKGIILTTTWNSSFTFWRIITYSYIFSFGWVGRCLKIVLFLHRPATKMEKYQNLFQIKIK